MIGVWSTGELDPYRPEPINWCGRCGVHAAVGTLCPVCADKARHSDTAAKMASMCRG